MCGATVSEWISEINTWAYGIATAIGAGAFALVRKIITNERQIDLLKAEITVREEYRKQRDEAINAQLSEIRDDVKQLMVKHG
jgi:hypothetical protein